MKELINIICELKAPKDQFNDAGKYKYRTQEGILEAVKPLLKKYQCILFLTDEIKELQVPYVYHEERKQNGNAYTIDYNGSRVYIEATATIVNSSGESISVKGIAREDVAKYGMAPSQLTGAASSYARKYALNGLFCIDDTKDDDVTNTHDNEEQPTQPSAPKHTATYDMAINALHACKTASETTEVFKTWQNRVGNQLEQFKVECRAMYDQLNKAS